MHLFVVSVHSMFALTSLFLHNASSKSWLLEMYHVHSVCRENEKEKSHFGIFLVLKIVNLFLIYSRI